MSAVYTQQLLVKIYNIIIIIDVTNYINYEVSLTVLSYILITPSIIYIVDDNLKGQDFFLLSVVYYLNARITLTIKSQKDYELIIDYIQIWQSLCMCCVCVRSI